MNERGYYGQARRGWSALAGAEPSGALETVRQHPRTINYLLGVAVLAAGGAIIAKTAVESPKRATAIGIVGGLLTSAVLSTFIAPKTSLF